MANRVVVLLSDGELEVVQQKAGLVPLSAWFRALALGAKKPSKQAVQAESRKAADPIAQTLGREDIDYMNPDELPSAGSVGAPDWRANRKPLLKPKDRRK
jgi:hypothetical protein